MGFAEGAQPALDQGSVGQHPAVQGGVIDLEAALEEQLFDVTVAQRIAQIPGDGLQDQRCLEVAAFEIVLRPPLQLLDKGVQDHRPPPVRRRIWRPHAQREVNAKTLRQPLSSQALTDAMEIDPWTAIGRSRRAMAGFSSSRAKSGSSSGSKTRCSAATRPSRPRWTTCCPTTWTGPRPDSTRPRPTCPTTLRAGPSLGDKQPTSGTAQLR